MGWLEDQMFFVLKTYSQQKRGFWYNRRRFTSEHRKGNVCFSGALLSGNRLKVFWVGLVQSFS